MSSISSPAWVSDLFSTIDAMDPEKFVAFLDEQAEFKFGNFPPAKGKSQIEGAVSDFYGSIKGLSHTLQNSWQVEDSVIVQGDVTYTRKDDSQVTLPFMNHFGMNGDLVKNYQIYIDIAPLYAEG